MAASNVYGGFIDTNDIYNLLDCPVCLEKLSEPYILKCGHTFCKVCLEGIASNHTLGHVTCPSCRHVTELTANGVSDLPMSILANQLQSHISSFIKESKKCTELLGASKYCQLCTGSKHVASLYCQKCNKYYCDVGKSKHKGLEHVIGHTSLSITPDDFCSTHPNEHKNLFCDTCSDGICSVCFLDKHHEHEIKDIQVMAKKSREHLNRLVKKCAGYTVPNSELESLRSKVKGLECAQHKLLDSVDSARTELKKLEARMQNIQLSIKSNISDGIDKLRSLDNKVQEFNATHAQTVLGINTLLAGAPSALEIILKDKEISQQYIGKFEYEENDFEYKVPIMDDAYMEIIRGIKKKLAAIDKKYHTEWARATLKFTPFVKPMNISSINTGNIAGLTTDSSHKRLLVCPHWPGVKSFKYNGKINHEFSVHGEEGKACSGIALDDKKCLYLVAVKDTLLRIDKEGYARDIIKCGHQLSAVSYCKDNNLYVVGSREANRILVIDPLKKITIVEFGVSAIGGLHTGTVHGIGHSIIAVSDTEKNSVSLYTMTGQLLKLICGGEGQLDSPTGLSTDPAGRLVVCDRGHRRLVAFWSEHDTDRWQVLLTAKDLDGSPSQVTFDHSNRILAVSCGQYTNIFKG